MDYGHKETDKMLSELEARIEKEYRKANKEVGEKLDNYLKRFEKKDEIKRKALSDGAITKQEYNQWRIGQVMIGKRWEEMRDTLAQDLTNANKIAASMINGFTPEVYALNHNYGTFEVEKGSLLNTSYTLYDRHTVERLIRDQPNLLPRAKVPIDADKRYNRQLLTSAVTQGVLQGKPMKDIAKDIFPEIRSKASFEGLTKRQASALERRIKNSAIRNARTMTTSAENRGRKDSYERAEKMGIKLKNQWVATLDGRTRHSHRLLDGEVRKINDEFSNGCEFPGDPAGEPEEVYNCRCTLIAVVDGIDYDLANVSHLNGKLGDMTYEEWREAKTGKKLKMEPDIPKSELRKALEESNISYLKPDRLTEKLSSMEIAEKLAGGDMTGGSCASLSMAYAANKGGQDVLDFRGGDSMKFFSKGSNLDKIAQLQGVEGYVVSDYDDFKTAKELLKNVVEGKEYAFGVGKHMAIIRKGESGFEYLEMQSAKETGFRTLDSRALKWRFGCQKSHSYYGTKYKISGELIEVESLGNNPEFQKITGYINTLAEKQQKGAFCGIK